MCPIVLWGYMLSAFSVAYALWSMSNDKQNFESDVCARRFSDLPLVLFSFTVKGNFPSKIKNVHEVRIRLHGMMGAFLV